MLIEAPWFVFAMPPMNATYAESAFEACFDSIDYVVEGFKLTATAIYQMSWQDGERKYVTGVSLEGFPGYEEVEFVLVTQHASFYHELPFPASEGTPIWLLMTSLRRLGGKDQRWGISCTDSNFLEDHGEACAAFCRQIAARFMPQRPS